MITISIVSSETPLELFTQLTRFYGHLVGHKQLILHMVPRNGKFGDRTGHTEKSNQYIRDYCNTTTGRIQVLLEDLWAREVTAEDVDAVRAMALQAAATRAMAEQLWQDSTHGKHVTEALEGFEGSLEVIVATLVDLAEYQEVVL